MDKQESILPDVFAFFALAIIARAYSTGVLTSEQIFSIADFIINFVANILHTVVW